MINTSYRLVRMLLCIIQMCIIVSCQTSNLEARMNALEQSQARQYYLLRCDMCDLYAKPGTPENQDCILMETKRWITIKKKRGWT
jgi:hypothetical protein